MPKRISLLFATLVVLASLGQAQAQSPPPPEVLANSLGTSYVLNGPAVAVDPSLVVSSFDPFITGASEVITNFQAGDVLHYTPLFGIFDTYSSGVLNLVGTATPLQYEIALDSITFSTTGGTGTRDIGITAYDSAAIPQNSNTALVGVVVTPEPASVVMMALGAFALLGFGWRRARRS